MSEKPIDLDLIRSWRNRGSANSGVAGTRHWRDVDVLLSEIDRLQPIVRGLAALRCPCDAGEVGVCPICLAEAAMAVSKHREDCAFRRAREYTERKETT